MSYKFLPHTADVRMRVSGQSLEELFQEAVRGMTALVHPKLQITNHKSVRKVRLSSLDVTPLLIDFLNEVLAQMEIHKEVYEEVAFASFSPTALEATLSGRPVESFQKDIKAVTYHEAEVRKNERGEWETTIVFDI